MAVLTTLRARAMREDAARQRPAGLQKCQDCLGAVRLVCAGRRDCEYPLAQRDHHMGFFDTESSD